MKKLVYFPGSLVFFLYMSLSAIIIGVLALCIQPFSFRVRYGLVSQWAKTNLFVLRWVCGVRMRVQRRGAQPEGAALVLCKHQSA